MKDKVLLNDIRWIGERDDSYSTLNISLAVPRDEVWGELDRLKAAVRKHFEYQEEATKLYKAWKKLPSSITRMVTYFDAAEKVTASEELLLRKVARDE